MRSAIALAALGAITLVAQETPVIRVPVHLVTVPTLVFSKEGQLVPGLRAADFRIFDNGRAQIAVLDVDSNQVSVVLAIQANQDVREYIPFIAKVGSIVEALLVGESGEATVVTYADQVAVAKPFDTADVPSAFKKLSATGQQARMIDAGLQAISLLKQRPGSRTRVLLLIGQPVDIGSESSLALLQEQAQKKNVVIHALTLPEIGKAFVSDTFSLNGVSSTAKGGFQAGVDLKNLVSVLHRTSSAQGSADPFSVLTAATGGTQLHFRKQNELERAITALGVELRSSYLLSYSPNPADAGYHQIKVEVAVAGATVYTRPGYWLSAN
jgi:VWFA-related protein